MGAESNGKKRAYEDPYKHCGLATRAIHSGQEPDPATGAIMTPIYQTSTYVQEAPDVHKGFDYARTNHPTRLALERNIAALENGKYGLCFGSGSAAASAVVQSLNQGDHVVSCNDLYGGTYRMFTKVYERFGVSFSFVDASDIGAIDKAITPKTKLLWIETPSNPLLKLCDIRAVAKLAKERGVKLCVDNTFATPVLQQPLEMGADIVAHSTTKYIGGHSDVVGGAVVTNDEEIYEKLKFLQNATGAVPGPMDCFLVLRGTKTLPLRMERHSANALQIARKLLEHPEVACVNYPGLPTHPQYDLAKAQMRLAGGMISFELKGDLDRAVRFLKSCKVFSLAESLGGVESLLGHPATMTHASIPREERLKAGLTDGLIRLSVGIEDEKDLMADLERAIAKSLDPKAGAAA
ncbi:MAG: cystathionine gamma-synthase [Elusimicrobia bacterium CG_4_9_14_3_um_filter_62_55]|nr:MAG: cystathionine gamma-synthase [Elusimicrobia bacterium CG22_combo_CG10-13_8_21_14_all_63_91]PJA16418.1 MAG: cystathionine gamma-synthase [Elusimicrobia bacterium CG_4_10_14_0_2_um_filter_63_34]PJB25706.1 MAG: cystathionine gamma-synthase [Elusimicrobia bacterium CG_4_9_14_3_um_filter_62_55]